MFCESHTNAAPKTGLKKEEVCVGIVTPGLTPPGYWIPSRKRDSRRETESKYGIIKCLINGLMHGRLALSPLGRNLVARRRQPRGNGLTKHLFSIFF